MNHAFFPFFPYLVNSMSTYFGAPAALTTLGFLLQLVFSWLNTVLIYKVGVKVLSVKSSTESYTINTSATDVTIAEIGAYFYIFSHSMLY
jgi:hypothetical protein